LRDVVIGQQLYLAGNVVGVDDAATFPELCHAVCMFIEPQREYMPPTKQHGYVFGGICMSVCM